MLKKNTSFLLSIYLVKYKNDIDRLNLYKLYLQHKFSINLYGTFYLYNYITAYNTIVYVVISGTTIDIILNLN